MHPAGLVEKQFSVPLSVFFMLGMIPAQCNGLYISSLRRAELFRQHLQLSVRFITHQYQSDIRHICETHMASGQVSEIEVINLYDYFQEIDRTLPAAGTALPDFDSAMRLVKVRDCNDVRVFAGTERIMYCGIDATGSLRYVNHFLGDKKARRDRFDTQGFLSRTEFLDTVSGLAHTIVYYRPDHTPAMTELFKISDGKAVLQCVHLQNRAGHVTGRFTSRDALVEFFVRCVVGSAPKPAVCIFDKRDDYHTCFRKDRLAHKAWQGVSLWTVEHNNHISRPGGRHWQTPRMFQVVFSPENHFDRIIVLTEQQKKDILQVQDAQNVHVIPHAVPYAAPLDTAAACDPCKILFVGRLVQDKQPHKALDALEQILETVPQATLHMYGKGPLEEELKARAEASMGQSVIFHGYCQDMRPVFASAAVMMQTSLREGFPLVILESLSSGCPVAAFDCKYGPAAMIEDGVNGFLIPQDDCHTLARRITTVLQSRQLRESLSANAKKGVQCFSQTVVAAQWAKLLLDKTAR